MILKYIGMQACVLSPRHLAIYACTAMAHKFMVSIQPMSAAGSYPGSPTFPVDCIYVTLPHFSSIIFLKRHKK